MISNIIISKNKKHFEENFKKNNFEKIFTIYYLFEKKNINRYFGRFSTNFNFYVFFFSFFLYNIIISKIIENRQTGVLKTLKTKQIDNMTFFLTIKIYKFLNWNIELINTIENIFLKELGPLQKKTKNEFISKYVYSLIRNIPVNQIKIFQNFFYFNEKKYFYVLFEPEKKTFMKLASYVSRINLYFDFGKYINWIIINMINNVNKSFKNNKYKLKILENVKRNVIINKKKKDIHPLINLSYIIFIFKKYKKQKQIYNIIKRKKI
jgi:hypothetical protein